jgi:hypothetical protein
MFNNQMVLGINHALNVIANCGLTAFSQQPGIGIGRRFLLSILKPRVSMLRFGLGVKAFHSTPSLEYQTSFVDSLELSNLPAITHIFPS